MTKPVPGLSCWQSLEDMQFPLQLQGEPANANTKTKVPLGMDWARWCLSSWMQLHLKSYPGKLRSMGIRLASFASGFASFAHGRL